MTRFWLMRTKDRDRHEMVYIGEPYIQLQLTQKRTEGQKKRADNRETQGSSRLAVEVADLNLAEDRVSDDRDRVRQFEPYMRARWKLARKRAKSERERSDDLPISAP